MDERIFVTFNNRKSDYNSLIHSNLCYRPIIAGTLHEDLCVFMRTYRAQLIQHLPERKMFRTEVPEKHEIHTQTLMLNALLP
jgi:hypothetical protein